MRRKIVNLIKAFMAGFITVAVVLWLMQLIAPLIGFGYKIGWKATFEMSKSTFPVIYASWFAPILVGLIFALFQLVDDFEDALRRRYRQLFSKQDTREAVAVLWNGAWGLAIGFVLSMFLLAIIAGTDRTYTIPYLLDATAKGGTVRATTSIMTLFTILGLVWGLWKAEHLPKRGKRPRHA